VAVITNASNIKGIPAFRLPKRIYNGYVSLKKKLIMSTELVLGYD